jgi:hypothetical protein
MKVYCIEFTRASGEQARLIHDSLSDCLGTAYSLSNMTNHAYSIYTGEAKDGIVIHDHWEEQLDIIVTDQQPVTLESLERERAEQLKEINSKTWFEVGDYYGCGTGERSLFADDPRYAATTHMEAVKMYLKDKGITAKIRRSGEYGSNHFVAVKVAYQNGKWLMDYRKPGVCKCWFEFVPERITA